jgi:UDP-GlcNAc:undecaprenyl-phosphate GlcNAc-1-phosphate transferase
MAVSDVGRVAAAFALACAVAMLAAPLARRLALRTDFLDHPVGYKGHGAPTPYLGGLAVMAGFLAAFLLFADGLDDRWALLGGALGLLAVGTLDDRVGLGIAPRLAAQVAAALALWGAGAGWDAFGSDAADLALTLFWVAGLINALNLMDNLDGACSSVAGASALGIAALALINGDEAAAAAAAALAGACVGFLPSNLARPAKSFLGDGGSVPIGFILAALIMGVDGDGLGWAAVLASAPLAGLVILDTTLVVISRRRGGRPVLEGGRDHLTHRVLLRAGTPRRVATVLAGAQLLLCALAIGLHRLETGEVALATLLYLGTGALVLASLERSMEPERAEAERAR